MTPSNTLANLPRNALAKVPSQLRSAKRVHAILDAAVEVLALGEEGGFDTNRVADRAGVSVGSLYQYFPNKQAVLAGVLERGLHNTEAVARTVVQAMADAPLQIVIRQSLEGMVDLLLPHRIVISELLRNASIFDEPSVLRTIERPLLAITQEWLDAHPAATLAHGPATLYVGLGGGIFLFLKWIVEQPEAVPRGEFLAALTKQVTAGVDG
jgi:AcrR family transcriptional regulator